MIKYAVNLWGKDIEIETEESRDSYLTNFGRATLENRYMSSGESYQDLFARVATHYADDSQHAQRLYDYISKLWFMPATPISVSYTVLEVTGERYEALARKLVESDKLQVLFRS